MRMGKTTKITVQKQATNGGHSSTGRLGLGKLRLSDFAKI